MKTFRLLRYQNEKNLGRGSGLIFYVIGGQTEIHRGESELLAQGRTVAEPDGIQVSAQSFLRSPYKNVQLHRS